MSEVERQLEAMRAGSIELYGEQELAERVAGVLAGRRGPLRVKLGLDPSAPDLHLGHSVVLRKLREFQRLGHTAILLVGDFTARIGDPSGRKKTRPALGREEVERNAATYVAQASRVLDVESAEIRWNGEWMDRLGPGEWIRLCSRFTVARLLERDDFARRYAAGEPISVHELLYPFAQAYDSVALEADVELGGTDQTFNLLMAREIQRDYGQVPQAVITLPLLVGTDGVEKMSKSLGNHVGLTEAPEEIYGKVMSISDELMADWYRSLEPRPEELPEGAWALEPGGDPLARKQQLAAVLVARFHGAEAARGAAEHFRRVFRRKQAPDEVPEAHLAAGPDGERGLLELLHEAGLAGSNSEARRLVAQGAVQVDGERVRDPNLRLGRGRYLIKVGKRRFVQALVG
jgi:tyrosyl-tRNA synthetase